MEENGKLAPDIFAELLRTAFDPEIVKCMSAIRSVADCDIPPSTSEVFGRFHRSISDPRPPYIQRLRADNRTELKWYGPHVQGILGDVRGGLAAAHYHAARLGDLEREVTAILAQSTFRDALKGSTMGLGGTRKLDIEYQAFILAYRRSLDYLAGALAAYFKIEASSFRTLPKSIARSKMPDVADAVISAHTRHAAALSFVLAEGRQSVRHRIAHYEFVSAGCINLNSSGFRIVGGGEEIGIPGTPVATTTLVDTLAGRMSLLHACIEDMIDTFILAAQAHDNSV